MEKTAPLTSRSLLRLAGSEAIAFMQNLITCDIEHLQPDQATFGALLTPQGKVFFDFIVLRENDALIIDVDGSQRGDLMKRLSFYKLRADVTISDDPRKVFAIWGGESSTGFNDPRHTGMGSRLFAESHASNATEDDWHALRISLGMPHSGLDFDLASLFPHDALMDQFETGGVDFSKGCYVGQEVVSRMHHRATARNRFVQISTKADRLADPGTEITADGRKIGTMGSHAGNLGMALVRVDRVQSAVEAGVPITIGEQEVDLKRPAFAKFDFPS